MVQLIDFNGTITLDRASDASLGFRLRKQDGQLADLSTTDLKFIIDGGVEDSPPLLVVQAVIDPEDDQTLRFDFTEAHAALLAKKTWNYMILLTSGDKHAVFKRGKIRAAGFPRD